MSGYKLPGVTITEQIVADIYRITEPAVVWNPDNSPSILIDRSCEFPTATNLGPAETKAIQEAVEEAFAQANQRGRVLKFTVNYLENQGWAGFTPSLNEYEVGSPFPQSPESLVVYLHELGHIVHDIWSDNAIQLCIDHEKWLENKVGLSPQYEAEVAASKYALQKLYEHSSNLLDDCAHFMARCLFLCHGGTQIDAMNRIFPLSAKKPPLSIDISLTVTGVSR